MYVHDQNLELYIVEHSAFDAAPKVSAIETHPRDYCGSDKRREIRFATNEPASLQSLNPLSAGQVPVRIVDVSKRGLKIRGQRFIAPGTQVHLRLKGAFIVGEIRYSLQAAGSFLAGVRVDDVYRPAAYKVGL
jgi:hypothetical protein